MSPVKEKIMLLFSYIFHSVYKGYNKSGDEHPGIYAVGIVSLLQFFTVVGAILLPVRLRNAQLGVPYWQVFLVILVVMLINYLYFYKANTPEKISEKILSLSEKETKVLRVITWVYVAIIAGAFIFLANLP
jgi:hypothetical protein